MCVFIANGRASCCVAPAVLEVQQTELEKTLKEANDAVASLQNAVTEATIWAKRLLLESEQPPPGPSET